jgi:predicted CXXCH cytochrome family protein
MSGQQDRGRIRRSALLRWGLVFLGVAALVFGGYRFSLRYGTGLNIAEQKGDGKPALLPAGSDAGYVDAAACMGCHREIWETYRQTGMGRSLTRPSPEAMIEDFSKPIQFYHQASDQHFTIYEKDGKYYQRRHQVGFDGKETNVVEKQIDFVVGSGNHARTYLHRTPEGGLFELPVAWYAEKSGHWGMNPSYDRPNHPGFRREILHECMFCHTGYPEIAPGTDRAGGKPRFPGRIPEGIDCQRCHGPGRGHIEAAKAGRDLAQIREAIVNPGKLDAERQMDVCLQCHLETTSSQLPNSVRRFDRGVFSYRPGESLAGYELFFDHAPGTGHDDKFQIAHQGYRLRKSACFQQSAGQMTCTTCHNPHDVLRGEAAKRQYAAVCQTCHQDRFKTLVRAGRHTASGDCLTCHMPKRRTEDVVHVVMTDHYIQRRKPARDLLAPLKESHVTEETAYNGPVTLYYPRQAPPTEESELYLAMAQVKHFSNLKAGVPQLAAALAKYRPETAEFYFELAEAYAHIGQFDDAIRRYREAVSRKPGFRAAWVGLGTTLSKSGQDDRGAEALRQALELDANDASILNDLGLILLRQGDLNEAAATFRRAVESDPDFSEAHNNLGGVLRQTGDGVGAERSYRSAIRLQPDYAAAHDNLATLLMGKGDFAQAEHHFRKSIEADGRFAPARLDYGVALAAMERYDEARVQFETAVKLNPARAEAHSGLADMLAVKGMAARAIQHYERALAIDSEMGAARLGLGSALVSQARFAEAVTHLERAARSSEPGVRQAALEALQAIQSRGKPF